MKNKGVLIIVLAMIVIVLTGYTLLNINSFMREYKLCKDDFEIIERCGYLPAEGNYSYFLNKYPSSPRENSFALNGAD